MNHSRPAKRRRRIPWWGVAPTIYAAYLTVTAVGTMIAEHSWPSPPPSQAAVSVDVLQGLGLLVALTALAFAVATRIVSKFKDFTDALDKTVDILEKIEEIPENEVSEEDEPTKQGRFPWVSGIGAPFRHVLRTARIWYPWFLVCYYTVFIVLRARWIIYNADFQTSESGTTSITINVLATISFLVNWTFMVGLITERVVHMGKVLERSTERQLERAESLLRHHQEE